jgi:hypothetical protein
VPLWLFKIGRPRWAWGIAVTPFILVLSHYVALDYAGRIGLLGLGTTVWYFATCGVLLWPRKKKSAALRLLPEQCAPGDPPKPALAA